MVLYWIQELGNFSAAKPTSEIDELEMNLTLTAEMQFLLSGDRPTAAGKSGYDIAAETDWLDEHEQALG